MSGPCNFVKRLCSYNNKFTEFILSYLRILTGILFPMARVPIYFYTLRYAHKDICNPIPKPLLASFSRADKTFSFRNWTSCLIYAKYIQGQTKRNGRSKFVCCLRLQQTSQYYVHLRARSYVILYKYLKLHLNPGTFVQLLELHNSFVEPSAKKSIQEGKQKTNRKFTLPWMLSRCDNE